MDDDDVKKAIERGRLPMDIFQRALIVFYIIAVCYVVSIFPAGLNTQYSISKLLLYISMIALLGIFAWTSLWSTRQLMPYSSDLSIERKKAILENLVDNPDFTCNEEDREDNYYRFSERKSWSMTFNIIVIYNNSGYYVNSTESSGSMQLLSTYKMEDIIKRIKNLESEV